MELFKFEIKGITLNECDMQKIKEYYEVCCTAEYLIENYKFETEFAFEIATEVRRIMFKYEYSEDEAITKVLASRGNINE